MTGRSGTELLLGLGLSRLLGRLSVFGLYGHKGAHDFIEVDRVEVGGVEAD